MAKKDPNKLKIEEPESIKDIELPILPQWEGIINRPTSLSDLDQTAQDDIDNLEATFLTLGDLAYLSSITVTEITDNAVTTPKIFAGAITSAKISVGQLDAISADLGEITAGTITGVLFRTATTGERIEIDTTNVNQIRFYDDNTLYGFIEADRVGTDGYINLLTDDGNGIQLDTGVGASGFNAVSMFANGGTFSTSGSASNGFIGMYADGANEFFHIVRSAGVFTLETDMSILPEGDRNINENLGSASHQWNNLFVDDIITYDDIDVGGDLRVVDDITVGDNLFMTDGKIDIALGFLNLARMTGTVADARTDSEDGSMYYRSTDDVIRVKLNGTWKTITTS